MPTIQQLIDQGEAKGAAKGKAEGQRQLLARQITKRFGTLPPATEAQLTGADGPTLERWAERILDVTSAEELVTS